VKPVPLAAPTLDEIRAARARHAGAVLRTPLVRLPVEGPAELWLKLETLQPINSFKIRGARNAMALLPPDRVARGVFTASAGNMAQGVAWCARQLGTRCDVVVPDHAPATKLAAIERLGGRIVPVPFERWWRVLEERRFDGLDGAFIHPVADAAVIAGNATIGLELLEDLPDVDAVVAPYGGGGLSTGIAAALRALAPRVPVFAAEPDTAAPLAASLAAGRPVPITYRASFIDGSGGRAVLPEMWPLARDLLAGSLTVTPDQVAAAIRLIAERIRVIAEGAGALALAAALTGRVPGRRIVCIVSGGNIDSSRLGTVLAGATPA
jgi:threonine dehydratase